MAAVCAGLQNPRNLCFFNCTMQALAALPPVHDFFRAVAEAAYRGMETAYASARRAAEAKRASGGSAGGGMEEDLAAAEADVPQKVPGLLSRVLRFLGGAGTGEEGDEEGQDDEEGLTETYSGGEGLVFEWDKQLTTAAELAVRLLCLLQNLAFVYYAAPPEPAAGAAALPPDARKQLYSTPPRMAQSASSVLGKFLDNIYDGSQQDSNELLLALLAFVDDAGLGEALAAMHPRGLADSSGGGGGSGSSDAVCATIGRAAAGLQPPLLARMPRLPTPASVASPSSLDDPMVSPRSGPSREGASHHSSRSTGGRETAVPRLGAASRSGGRGAGAAASGWVAGIVAGGRRLQASSSSRSSSGDRSSSLPLSGAAAPSFPLPAPFRSPSDVTWTRLLRDLHNPFAGSVCSRTMCLACESRRRLAAAAPSRAAAGAARVQSRPWRTEVVSCLSLDLAGPTLEACLGAFFRDSPVHDFDCGDPGCRGGRVPGSNPTGLQLAGGRGGSGPNALIQTRLARPPPVLAVHLKRLTHPGVKVGARVDFKAVLDMRPFLSEGRAAASSGSPGGGESEPHASCIYDLMAVVVHLGGGGGGHYVTYRRVPAGLHTLAPGLDSSGSSSSSSVPSRWVRASDRHVDPVPEGFEAVRAQEAYMLFYVARGGSGRGDATWGAGVEAAEAVAAASRVLAPVPEARGAAGSTHACAHSAPRGPLLHPRRAVLARRDAGFPADVSLDKLEAAGVLPLLPLWPAAAAPAASALPASEGRRFLSVCPPWIRAALWGGLLTTPATAAGTWAAHGAAAASKVASAHGGGGSGHSRALACGVLAALGYGGQEGGAAAGKSSGKGLLSAALWAPGGPIAAAAAGAAPPPGWVFSPLLGGAGRAGGAGLAAGGGGGGQADDDDSGEEEAGDRPCLALAWY